MSAAAAISPVFPSPGREPALWPFGGLPSGYERRPRPGLPSGSIHDPSGELGGKLQDVEPGIGGFGAAFLVGKDLPELIEGFQFPAGELAFAPGEIRYWLELMCGIEQIPSQDGITVRRGMLEERTCTFCRLSLFAATATRLSPVW